MDSLSGNNFSLTEKVLQFGEGNFLRAFADYFIDMLNEKGHFNGSIVVVQPIEEGLIDTLNSQQGRYTVLLRGLENGKPTVNKRVISSISRGINPYKNFDEFLKCAENPNLRFIISNTTEAGIRFSETDKLTDRPPSGFPGKVTAFLFERYQLFGGDVNRGFIFIPCELIDNSGDRLKETVLQYARHWGLPDGFVRWVTDANYFTNTLVDRIVTGYPEDEADKLNLELGYTDKLLTTAELFHFFAIEAKGRAAKELSESLPFHKIGLNVRIVDDVSPYKTRKVRILNGAHTMSVLAALICGKETVSEMINDPLFARLLEKGIYEEIIPVLDLDESDLKSFADSVFDRFANPYIKHNLTSIALNSVSKFTARVLPTILDYHKKNGCLPEILTLSFAALILFYKKGLGTDDNEILAFFENQPTLEEICARMDYWGTNLNDLPGFREKVLGYLENFNANGMEEVIKCSL